MKLVVDASALAESAGLAEAVAASGLPARLALLGLPIVVWGGASAGLPAPVADWQSLLAALAGEPAVLVSLDQILLDVEVARQGLAAAAASPGWDCFTQWEQCRLPIGLGIRIVSAGALSRVAATSPAAAIAEMVDRPQEFVFRYDDHAYCGHGPALLDARWRPALTALPVEAAIGLGAFLQLAEGSEESLRFAIQTEARTVDERGMAAPYGFESSATADFPTYLMFDLTNKCNATCVHCPQSVGFPGSDIPTYLDVDIFKRAIDESVGRPMTFVRITADGEPLLHPRFWELLEYARDKGVGPVGLTTNGSGLNERNARRLLEAGVFMVDISLDAFSPEAYAIVRAGLSYERTMENVLRLLDLRAEMKSPLKVMVSFVKQKENAGEVDAFRDYWQPKLDQVLIREMISNVGINDVTDSVTEAQTRRWPCPHVFRREVVNYDGKSKYCPIDWVSGSVLEPLAGTTLRDIWLGEDYRRLRLAHLNNDFADSPFCGGCRDWRGSPWDLGYEKVVARLVKSD